MTMLCLITSGYWQLPMHPSMWKYLAFKVDGQVYCFTHLPFGVAPACFIYTTLKQEIFRPLREAGLRMTFLIDDQITLERGAARTQAMCEAMCKLLASLGFTLSLPKCQLEPSQLAKYLGLLVDLLMRRFQVPAAKVEQLSALVQECQQAGYLSNRLVAKVAGKVMALSPAIELAPLLARDMWKLSQGSGWDDVYTTPQAFNADLELMVELLARSNGRNWAKRSEVVLVVGDASESALAAYFPNKELEGEIMVPFTAEQMAAVKRDQWSSTARELCVLEKVGSLIGVPLA